MFSIKRSLSIVLACVFVIACNQSEDKDATATSTTESSLSTNPSPTTTTTIQDIWVLDSLNNKAPDSNYFSHGTPYFEFNLDKKTFSGHTGCNGINGKLSEVNGKLVFDSLQFSTEVCKDKGFEKKLLKAFKSGVTYTILNDRLHMNIDPTTVYIFRKIRR
ncbi:MAG TPA: META domain-containing protein [Candidatus Nitrosocosmicus sp.]|nr:META domain-containing protein [Candidatus Nitrosocosmicus sp.]